MIKVKISKDLIKVSGHAKYAKYGNDIVCASVSSIIYTTINGILNIDKNAISVEDVNDLIIKINKHSIVIDTLIDNMNTLLLDLSKQYPKNIKIDKGE